MALKSGTQLGSYEILSPLGKGGMGEVWRARDQKLGREVAIKTLPEEFAKDEERLARFEREAKLLASLNHPNIATIRGLEEHEGTRFLVLELVEGDTLAERLKRGAIPVEESLKLALQIAEALEAAHEKGVVHRDLKPANIKVTPNGKVVQRQSKFPPNDKENSRFESRVSFTVEPVGNVVKPQAFPSSGGNPCFCGFPGMRRFPQACRHHLFRPFDFFAASMR